MYVNIKRWNVYKNWIADELFDKPFDWLCRKEQLTVILLFQLRIKDGLI